MIHLDNLIGDKNRRHQQHLSTNNLSGKGMEVVSLCITQSREIPKATQSHTMSYYHAQVIALLSYAGLGSEHRRIWGLENGLIGLSTNILLYFCWTLSQNLFQYQANPKEMYQPSRHDRPWSFMARLHHTTSLSCGESVQLSWFQAHWSIGLMCLWRSTAGRNQHQTGSKRNISHSKAESHCSPNSKREIF